MHVALAKNLSGLFKYTVLSGRGGKLLTKLKERIQLLMVGEAKLAHSIGLTPNQVSFLGLLSALFSAYLYWSSQFDAALLTVAALFLLISGFFDALDGVLARLYGEVTVFGGFLDSLFDRYADAFVFLGILMGWLIKDPVWMFWGFAALIGSLLVSYSRARAEAAGIKMETVGIAERAERIIILVVASLLSMVWADALRWSMLLLAVLTNLTVLQRVIYFRKASKKKEATTTPIV
jgi:archaetidylinositol phosphate synthase